MPAVPAIRPWSSACLPSVAETCDCEISFEADRQRAELDQVREVLRALDREAALDQRTVLAVDAVGQLLRVDRGDRDQSAVERDREVLQHRARVGARQAQLGAALRDLARDLLEGAPCRRS